MSGLGPAWVIDALASLMLASSGYGVGRLVAAQLWRRPLERDINVAHVVMGVAMAGMLVASLRSLTTGVWEGVFGVLAVWFAGRGVRVVVRRPDWPRDLDAPHHLGHYVAHLAMSVAMLYMFLAVDPALADTHTGVAAMSAVGTSHGAAALGLPLVLATVLLVSAVWHMDSLGRYSRAVPVRAAAAPAVSPQPWIAPRLEIGSHVAMCFTMSYLLVLMR